MSCLGFERHVSEWRVAMHILIPASVERVEYRNMAAKPSFSHHFMYLTQYRVPLGFGRCQLLLVTAQTASY